MVTEDTISGDLYVNQNQANCNCKVISLNYCFSSCKLNNRMQATIRNNSVLIERLVLVLSKVSLGGTVCVGWKVEEGGPY